MEKDIVSPGAVFKTVNATQCNRMQLHGVLIQSAGCLWAASWCYTKSAAIFLKLKNTVSRMSWTCLGNFHSRSANQDWAFQEGKTSPKILRCAFLDFWMLLVSPKIFHPNEILCGVTREYPPCSLLFCSSVPRFGKAIGYVTQTRSCTNDILKHHRWIPVRSVEWLMVSK